MNLSTEEQERIEEIRRELGKKQASGFGLGFAWSAIKFLLELLSR